MNNSRHSSWKEVTVEEYTELIEIIEDNNSFFSRALETVIFLTDDDTWEDASTNDVVALYKANRWVNSQPNLKYKQTIGEYHLKPLNKLSLAEWIDFDSNMVSNNFVSVIALLYRKTSVDKWGNIEYEPYLYSLKQRSELVLDFPIEDVFGVLDMSVKYRETILNNFKDVFSGQEEDLSEEEKEGLSDTEIVDIENDLKMENQKRDYSWQKLIDDLSGGNWSYSSKILDLPHPYVFNMLRMKKLYS